MMGLHDVLRNIEQMLAPFKHYIEAFEVGKAQVPSEARVPPMVQVLSMVQAQALPVVQATRVREPKFIMPEKFDGT
jgi:hypothetical protein